MVICIKQHLSNISSLVLEKVKQHWGWVEKKHYLWKSVYFWSSCFFYMTKKVKTKIQISWELNNKHFSPFLKGFHFHWSQLNNFLGRCESDFKYDFLNFGEDDWFHIFTQQTNTCSNSTIDTIEKDVR